MWLKWFFLFNAPANLILLIEWLYPWLVPFFLPSHWYKNLITFLYNNYELIIFQIIQTYHTRGNLMNLLNVFLAFFAQFEPRLITVFSDWATKFCPNCNWFSFASLLVRERKVWKVCSCVINYNIPYIHHVFILRVSISPLVLLLVRERKNNWMCNFTKKKGQEKWSQSSGITKKGLIV